MKLDEGRLGFIKNSTCLWFRVVFKRYGRMKKIIIMTLIIAALVAGTAFLILQVQKRAPENLQSELIEAQRLLGLLKRIGESGAFSGEAGSFVEVSAMKNKGRFQYSDGWSRLDLPVIRENLGFNFRCSADDICRAMEVKQGIETGNGMGCDVTTGEYECYGDFVSVTTRGFDGTDIVVGCKAPE